VSIACEFQILVTGGGLGGLATANFLSRAGVNPVVVERAEQFDSETAPVELWPDALTVLSWLDVEAPVRAAGSEVQSLTRRGSDGTVCTEQEADDHAGYVTIRYHRLRDLLRETLPAETVRTGTQVRHIEEDEYGVAVEFENGVTERFDAVVGADGTRSTVRAETKSRRPIQLGTTSGACPLNPSPDVEGSIEELTRTGAFLRIVPTGDEVWACFTVPSGASADRPESAVTHLADDSQVLTTDMLPEMRSEVCLWTDVRVESDFQTGQRVVLIGDAAHARHRLTGLGPMLALEDAVELMSALAQPDVALSDRLTAYATRRRERVRRMEPDDHDVSTPVVGLPGQSPLERVLRRRYRRTAATFSGELPTPGVDPPPQHV